MRKCPICQHIMIEDCYLENQSLVLNDYIVIEKTSDLKKHKYPLKLAICKFCGHIEFYTDIYIKE